MSPRRVSDILHRAASRWPSKPAIIGQDGQMTYRELLHAVGHVRDWLAGAGVAAGQHVMCAGESDSAMVVALLGVLDYGAVIVPVHPETPQSAAAFLVRDAAPCALCVSASAMPTFGAFCDGPTLLLSTEGNHHDRSGDTPPEQASEDRMAPDATAALMYTSGSTGPPRAVVCPHSSIVFAVNAISSVLQYRSEDVVLGTLPFSFDYGLYQVFLTLRAGATLVLAGGAPQVHLLPKLMRDHQVSVLPTNPSTVALLLRSGLLQRISLPALRLVTSTGEVLPEPHINRLQELFPQARISPMYGLTECKRVSICPPDALSRPPGTVGVPLPGTTVRVVDQTGHNVPPGDVGELVVRGPNVMAGYWNAPEETADRFRPGFAGKPELWTHDLFRQDGDGFLYFVGRSRSVIKSLGHRVGPSEVEDVIMAVPWVVEVAVVGVPDSLRGEAVIAFVVAGGTASIPELQSRCRENLLLAACPVQFLVQERLLPRTPNGKVDRESLRAAACRIHTKES